MSMEECDYELLFRMLCRQALPDWTMHEVLIEIIGDYFLEEMNKEKAAEEEDFLYYLIRRSNDLLDKPEPEYETALQEFLNTEVETPNETVWVERIIRHLADSRDPGISNDTVSERPGYCQIMVLLDVMHEQKHPVVPYVRKLSKKLIKRVSKNWNYPLPDGLIHSLFFSGSDDDWWMNHFDMIAFEKWDDSLTGTAGSTWISNRGNIYFKYHSDRGLEGPYQEGQEIGFNDHSILLKNGEVRRI